MSEIIHLSELRVDYIYVLRFRRVEAIISCLEKATNLAKAIALGKKIPKLGKKNIFILHAFLIFWGFSFVLFRNDNNFF